jgi:hypothetical protein
VTDSLTLNLGIRYQTYTPWVEVLDRQVNFAPISGEVELPGQNHFYSNNRALYNSYNFGLGNFQPRFGFAFTPHALGNKTVFRGAYTISSYLEGTGTNLRLPLNPPFAGVLTSIYDNLTYPSSTLDQGFTLLASPTRTRTRRFACGIRISARQFHSNGTLRSSGSSGAIWT